MATRSHQQDLTGVQETPSGGVRIRLKINGKWQWHTAPNCEATPKGLANAAKLRRRINRRQAEGEPIDWEEWLPGSTLAKEQAKHTVYIPTLGEMGEMCLDHSTYGGKKLAPGTLRGQYNAFVRIFRSLLDEDIDQIDYQIILENTKGVNENSFNIARNYANRTFKAAIRAEWIVRNPMDYVPKRYKAMQRSQRVLDEKQVEEALSYIGNYHGGWLSYFQFAFATGMRPSEQIALRWKNVDLDDGTIHVCESISKNVDRDEMKTESSRRYLPIYPLAAESLRTQKDITYGAGEHVFWYPVRRHAIRYATEPAKVWRKVRRALDLGDSVPYCTRHTFATRALINGASSPSAAVPVVSALMGHASGATTWKYVHALPSQTSAVNQALARVFK